MYLFTVYFLLFIFGAAVGSFLNVVIDRLETNEPIFTPLEMQKTLTGRDPLGSLSLTGLTSRSHCDSCGTTLRWYDLIPLLSFILLRRRCRYCGEKLSWQYPLVELATGLIFLLGFLKIINHNESFLFSLFFFLVISSAMVVIFVYDLKHKIIPDRIVLSAVVITLLFRIFEFLKIGPPANGLELGTWNLGFPRLPLGNLLSPLAGAVAAALFFLTLILVTRGRGMGFGDVKLAFLMGLILGWPKILIALYLSFISGALVGLVLIAIGKKRFGQEIPFGPFLAASTVVTLLYGNILLDLIQKLI